MKNEKIILAGIVGGVAVWWFLLRNPFAVLEQSSTASARGIANTIPELHHQNARGLLVVRERILSKTGAWVSSAYRSPALNAAVDGNKNSHHMQARALDFGGWTLDEIMRDDVLSLGITNKKSYESGRFHMSWAPEYLEMISQ